MNSSTYTGKTLSSPNIQTKLTKEQKEAVGLLSIGTFLEYFDLMLYVHMAVLLNELFFPKTDPEISKLLMAFTFCSTFVFRPLGALLFGYIGDNYGRKLTVVMTTIIMSISCFVMAIVPTYSEIGIMATYAVIICRIAQGMSSMGEIIGAYIYVTESIKKPMQYVVTAILTFLAGFGGFAALGVIKMIMMLKLDWRMSFWCGVLIALVGFVGRTALRETPEFINAKYRLKKVSDAVDGGNKNIDKFKNNKFNIKTFLAAFFIECPWPVCFYIAFFYFGEILKTSFNYSSEQIISHNLFISFIEILGIAPIIIFARYFSPISILKVRLAIFSVFMVYLAYIMNSVNSEFQITIIQVFIMFFVIDTTPAKSIIITHFPILSRFTFTGLAYSLSRMVMYVITSFGLIYLDKYLGSMSIVYVMAVVLIAYAWALFHFEYLEKEYDDYPHNQVATV